jgi:transposase-like protein
MKISIAQEALRAKDKDAEIASKNGIAPSTLCEWKEALLNGDLKTQKEKEQQARIEELEVQNKALKETLGSKELELELLKKNDPFLNLPKRGRSSTRQ